LIYERFEIWKPSQFLFWFPDFLLTFDFWWKPIFYFKGSNLYLGKKLGPVPLFILRTTMRFGFTGMGGNLGLRLKGF